MQLKKGLCCSVCLPRLRILAGEDRQKILQRGDQLNRELWYNEGLPEFTTDKPQRYLLRYYILNAKTEFEIHRVTCSLFDTVMNA